MQVSVETLSGLERKVTISVPTEKVEEEVGLRLKNLAKKVKVDGFRPGRVPHHVAMKIVQTRYADGVREDVAREMVQSTLFEALESNQLTPAGYPAVQPEQLEPGKDFRYTATFEVFPEISIVELNKTKVERIKANVVDADVDAMIEKLREQNKNWKEVSRKAENGDKVVIDFEGFLGDEPFEGGRATQHELILGSKSMIPGFEEGIVGAEVDKPFDIKVSFPEEYNHAPLAGKDAVFKITVHSIEAGELPPLDDAFASKFDIKEGGVEALKADIKNNMERELYRQVQAKNREVVFNHLMEVNPFDLPNALIEKEIEHLKHDMYHRLFGPQHSDHEKIPDFPRELFQEQAERRVHLGLLFSEYVKKHGLKATDERINAMIDMLATAYDSEDELRAWYRGDKNRMAELEALVLEDIVAEKIAETAEVVEKVMSFDEVMNPEPAKEKGTKKKKGA